MPAVIRGKSGGTRQLLVGHKRYATHYTLTSPTYGSICCHMRVVCNYHKGFKGKHGIHYTLYVVHRVTVALNQLHQHYKDRFGIETRYRIKNQCRIRTTSKNPMTRLLFVAPKQCWNSFLRQLSEISQSSQPFIYLLRYEFATY
ncbi:MULTISPECIES: hypothetical protein [unclassified Leptolyngbya]|uniref:hypothetical protein n=1 Tax=unclassified Leptolyngbya TaxID=2650499 RepID=UPI001F5589FA|nr:MULTISPECIES: hypothetical protein [unclassified Leptolyngbya]